MVQRILCIAALMAWVSIAPDAAAQTSLHPTSVEIAQLPRFCWGQLDVPGARGGEFAIVDCGPAANHYCSALIYMIRAKGHVQKGTRLGLLGQADTDVRYTEKAIADYPKCNIRDHVAATRAELESLMKIYGYNRPRAR
jgi:hypothetical protein